MATCIVTSVNFLERELSHMGIINFNVGVSSKFQYFGTLRTLYTFSDRARDGELARNGAR